MDVKEILQTIGERLQSGATVKCVYGDPITAGDRTVIPVARVKFGFGAGRREILWQRWRRAPCARSPRGMVEVTPSGSAFIAFGGHRRLGVAVAVGDSGGDGDGRTGGGEPSFASACNFLGPHRLDSEDTRRDYSERTRVQEL